MTTHQSYKYLPAALLALAVGGCDFSVTNPGPVEDRFLDEPTARRALVAGMRRRLADAINPNQGDVLYWSAAITFEINPSGSTGSFGLPPQVQDGRLLEEENNWSLLAQARWVAEDGIRRFKENSAPEDTLFAAARLWAGYANRWLGENFCDAVIDGGPLEPHTVFFTRAEGHFTEALRIANALTIDAARKAQLVNAAYAGRASVRADLASYNNNNAATWASAAADAAQVTPNAFRHQLPFSDQDQNQYNGMYWAQAGTPYKAHTQWATYYDLYNRTTPADTRITWLLVLQSTSTTVATASTPGQTTLTVASVSALGTGASTNAWVVVDPTATGSKEVLQVASVSTSANTITFKTPMGIVHAAGQAVRLAGLGDAGVAKFGGRVPHFPQQKYPARTSGINLSSGWEMRLIQAEEALVRGDFNTAVDFMNQRRGSITGLSNIPKTNLTDAWTALKAERAFELWLEGRRMPDLRRWNAASTPGTTFDGVYRDMNGDGVMEQVESVTSPKQRALCYPIGRAEKETNPNLPG